MSRKRKTAFLALMAIWFSVIASYSAYKEIILRFGHSVMLETMPFDPVDLFRGDYVNLRYDINVANKNQKILDYRGGVSSYNITGGETVYVMLVKDGKFYKGGDIRLKKPEKGKLSVQIRLGPDGEAVIEAIYIDGKKADFKNKNEKNN